MFRLTVVASTLVAILVALATAIYAQTESTPDKFAGESALIDWVGAEAVTNGNLQLRDSPPSDKAAWFVHGNKIGIALEGETIVVRKVTVVPAVWHEQYWFYIERADPSAGPDAGWVYYGGSKYLERLVEGE